MRSATVAQLSTIQNASIGLQSDEGGKVKPAHSARSCQSGSPADRMRSICLRFCAISCRSPQLALKSRSCSRATHKASRQTSSEIHLLVMADNLLLNFGVPPKKARCSQTAQAADVGCRPNAAQAVYWVGEFHTSLTFSIVYGEDRGCSSQSVSL